MQSISSLRTANPWAGDVDLEQRQYEQSNRDTAIASNELGLEAARIANESAKIDLQAKKAALKNQAANQAAASQMTNEFLAKWGDMNQATLDVLTKTLEGTFNSGGGVYGDLINDIKGQITQFDTNYGDMTKKAFDTTMADIDTRRDLVTGLVNEAQPDYRGVEGRAAADVSTQSELARQGMARDAMSYGVDPTSGNFGALMKKSFLRESRDKVDAMNKARLAEKESSMGLRTQLVNSIDPSVSAGVASNLMNQRGQLLGLQTQAAGAMSSAEKAKADTALGVANAIGGIGAQYGSLGSSLLGLQTAQGTYTGADITPTKKLNAAQAKNVADRAEFNALYR